MDSPVSHSHRNPSRRSHLFAPPRFPQANLPTIQEHNNIHYKVSYPSNRFTHINTSPINTRPSPSTTHQHLFTIMEDTPSPSFFTHHALVQPTLDTQSQANMSNSPTLKLRPRFLPHRPINSPITTSPITTSPLTSDTTEFTNTETTPRINNRSRPSTPKYHNTNHSFNNHPDFVPSPHPHTPRRHPGVINFPSTQFSPSTSSHLGKHDRQQLQHHTSPPGKKICISTRSDSNVSAAEESNKAISLSIFSVGTYIWERAKQLVNHVSTRFTNRRT